MHFQTRGAGKEIEPKPAAASRSVGEPIKLFAIPLALQANDSVQLEKLNYERCSFVSEGVR